MQDPLVN